MRWAAGEAHALPFIERLPGGFDAVVRERGAGLSVGQKQLIAFARALAFDPSILILDEATSSIDTETEQLIQKALDRLLEGRTSVVIAHRLSTIQKADRILVLHKGEVRELGHPPGAARPAGHLLPPLPASVQGPGDGDPAGVGLCWIEPRFEPLAQRVQCAPQLKPWRTSMARNSSRFLISLAAAALLSALPAAAQFSGVTLPPSGNNQYGSVTQGIGLVRVTIEYNSPHVHSPTGEDRHGKIWGGLVPFGMANLGFGSCGDQCPWRGGANENTVFTTSHDVKIQGQPLPAGSYGVHFIPGPEEWTIAFSKNHTSWGSYFYDVKEDALRVKAKPEKSEYHEWLTYEFTERTPDRATAALKWEDLQVPFTIAVDDTASLYMDNLRSELRSSPGFSWQNWHAAARYCLENCRTTRRTWRRPWPGRRRRPTVPESARRA